MNESKSLKYDVMKERGSNRYYVYLVNESDFRVVARFANKKKALKAAAHLQGLSLKEYLRVRKRTVKTE